MRYLSGCDGVEWGMQNVGGVRGRGVGMDGMFVFEREAAYEIGVRLVGSWKCIRAREVMRGR